MEARGGRDRRLTEPAVASFRLRAVAGRRPQRSMRSRCPGAVWSSRRNDAARPTTRTITDIRSRWRIGSSTSWAGSNGPYTGRWFASKSDTDIEHMVARSEAHDSGLCAADPATRRRFASDLLNLTLAGPRVNRYEKVDHDGAEWLPAQNRCWFAARVVGVRQRYGLTIDQREADALDHVLAGCGSTELITFARGAVPTTAAPRHNGPCLTSRSRIAACAPCPHSRPG